MSNNHGFFPQQLQNTFLNIHHFFFHCWLTMATLSVFIHIRRLIVIIFFTPRRITASVFTQAKAKPEFHSIFIDWVGSKMYRGTCTEQARDSDSIWQDYLITQPLRAVIYWYSYESLWKEQSLKYQERGMI